ncbi:MAG: tRNA (adenosine(37)-N6)-threonylcarbamoyltransferase complex ATPase subunit type 1 TsaE [Bacteroidetes bacterium]|nr:tRNA (adenosine(37)-N6)-threonylcarbamoyltransferase complex ATPase subunit type 1 TsaE [Bacteroidota bacterium]
MKIEMQSLADLQNAASRFLRFIENQPVRFVAFKGEMGAGKTTFISALMKEMKVEDHGSSPTFALINEYHSPLFGRIFHCDFYRLKSSLEALDLGVEEMFEDDAWIFAEWPERLGNLLPDKIVDVRIIDHKGCRIIEANV